MQHRRPAPALGRVPGVDDAHARLAGRRVWRCGDGPARARSAADGRELPGEEEVHGVFGAFDLG